MTHLASDSLTLTPNDGERQCQIDYDHLHRQTMGDEQLAGQIIQLFLQQCKACIVQLEGARQGKETLEIAHKFTGCAKAVGAFQLAQTADRLENNPLDTDAIAQLKRQCTQMCNNLGAAK